MEDTNIMRTRQTCSLLALLLTITLAAIGSVGAQAVVGEWEYLVVSYGTTYFSNPLLEADSANATFSKVQLFSEIGVTLPNEAITLQRNIDVLGKFGWEMVTVVGSIGGDQQILFKRPYDEQRSKEEAARIRAEREELIAAYNTSSASADAGAPAAETPKLVDLDAVERAQATDARNTRDASKVRGVVETAAASGYLLPELTVTGNAYSPDGMGRVTVQVTQDVTAAALVASGQYRSNLVTSAVEQFKAALVRAGFAEPSGSRHSCSRWASPLRSVSCPISSLRRCRRSRMQRRGSDPCRPLRSKR